MELSARSEGFLNLLRVGSMVIDGSSGLSKSSGGTGICCADVCAGLGMIDQRFSASLLVLAGLGDRGAVIGLLKLVRVAVADFSWFSLADMQLPRYRARLDRVTQCAISELVSGERLGKSEKARRVGISHQCYGKTWDARQGDVYKLISDWAMRGDYDLARVLRNDFSV